MPRTATTIGELTEFVEGPIDEKQGMIMDPIDLDGRCFEGKHGYDKGDFTPETRYEYHQTGTLVWATIRGGGVRFGTGIGLVSESGDLVVQWLWLSEDGTFKGGAGRSTAMRMLDGRIRLYEEWTATSLRPVVGSEGRSVAEEVDRVDDNIE